MRHAISALAACLVLAATGHAQVVTLYSFQGGTSDGQFPGATLVQSGSALYGMTYSGGSVQDGTIFSIGLGGVNYAMLYSIGASDTTGTAPVNPIGSLAASGSTLYGMTYAGGANSGGVVFSAASNGNSFQVAHNFPATSSDGKNPFGSLVQSGSVFYGMTPYGGSAGGGVIFKINADNSGYTVLHNFTGGTADGFSPYASLAVAGNTLYGTTQNGGATNDGTVFRMNTDGTGFALVHSFDASAGDGFQPSGTPVLSGSTLYGTSRNGGAGNGTIWSVGVNGGNFTVLHDFTGGPGGDGIDGGKTNCDLTVVGNYLYGMAPVGGRNSVGVLFNLQTDGSDYNIDYNFGNGGSDGASPEGSLILGSDGLLYGLTNDGGTYGKGTIFEFTPVPEPSTLLLIGTAGALGYLIRRRRLRARQSTSSDCTPDAAGERRPV